LFDLKQYLTAKQRQINQALIALFPKEDSTRIVEAMQYSLMADGKRVRPILCLAAAEAVGGNPDDAIEPACALEMIHTYSLIHDDLPGMDNDDLRRGQPTLHVAYDEATAILAGDALLTFAFEILTAESKHTLPDPVRLRVVQALARAAGHRGMIEGQMRDLAAEGQVLDLTELKVLHGKKTGALIKSALYIGALIGGGKPNQIDALQDFGENIGLAFQIVDDILNVVGDPDIIGKATGTDATRQKSTYPALLGLDQSRAMAHESIGRALQAITAFDRRADPLRALAAYIIERER
jgi:geranylgeranyl diphosphate synthase, type II